MTANTKKEILTIVLASDERYAMQLATALRSIFESSRNEAPIDVYVLASGLDEYAQQRVLDSLPKRSGSIHWVSVDVAAFAGFSILPHMSKMTFARLLIPEVLPEYIERVLYLDADLLVLGDVGPLWGIDLEGNLMGAVLDSCLDSQLKGGVPEQENLPRVRDYFNAGVLLIDLNLWRKQRVSGRALTYMARHPQTPFCDQDALNFVCDGRWKKLDSKWNCQDHCNTNILGIHPEQRPKIIHFVTWLKPWIARSLNPNADLYNDYRGRTRFARSTREEMTDALTVIWLRTKVVLKRSILLRIVWNYIKGKQTCLDSGTTRTTSTNPASSI